MTAPLIAARALLPLGELRGIVGRRHVLTRPADTAPYATGYRTGSGPVAAVIRPASLAELWQVFKTCIEADHIVIAQAANTGLTGGSTPCGGYDRPVVVINTLRIRGVIPLRGGQQVVCLAGATLYELERKLEPLGREPHSVIGSSCLGASVVGGICNNSGGALVSRGPAYTQYALYARVNASGKAELCNHLGLSLGDNPDEMLAALDAGRISDELIARDDLAASARDYGNIVRDVDAPSPARYNADPSRLFEASGSAGKVLVLAVRLDTFARPAGATTFYVGTNDPAELTAIRRGLLSGDAELPVSGEYIHRDAFNIAERYGKDTFLAIRWLGVDRLPALFRFKSFVDRFAARMPFLPAHFADRMLQALSRLFPAHLPRRMLEYRDRFAHHLLLKVTDTAASATRELLQGLFPSGAGDAFECDADEAAKAFLHRFAVAGAAVRYRAVHPRTVEDIAAIDVALRRNDDDWLERLPSQLSDKLIATLYYGHFFCHVFHQDYIVKKGEDVDAFEHAVLDLLAERGGEYPAEHNVGHLYCAKPALEEHYRSLDPGNRLNPGIGKTSRKAGWA